MLITMAKLKEPGDYSPELFNTEDVVFDVKPGRRRNEITLVARCSSKRDFNLIRYYLALKGFVEKIERELDLLEGAPDNPQ